MQLIGNPSCGAPCNTGCECLDILSANCIFYPGEDLPNTGIKTNDSLTEALIKINEAVLLSNNVPVSPTDNCLGSLNDKIIVGGDIVKSIVTVDGCQKLRFVSNAGILALETIVILSTIDGQTVFTSPDLVFAKAIALVMVESDWLDKHDDYIFTLGNDSIELAGAYSSGLYNGQKLKILITK